MKIFIILGIIIIVANTYLAIHDNSWMSAVAAIAMLFSVVVWWE